MAGKKDAREPKHRQWVKLWIKDALLGTMREDLTAEERGTWYDFLVLAGHSRRPGVICANEKTAMSPERIAAILNIDTNLLSRAMGKFVESGRVTVDSRGLIHITNWGKYQYSDYDRQKVYREKAKASAVAGVALDGKKRYGELANILLTEAEYEKCKAKFGLAAEAKIEELSLAVAAHGYKYKSHYAAILNWARRANEKAGPQPVSRPGELPGGPMMREIE